MFPTETCFVALDNSAVLTVKLGRETSFVAYSTDKRSKTVKINKYNYRSDVIDKIAVNMKRRSFS